MTIKEVSEITGVSIDNLRYYERIGILPAIPRNKSGIREYNEESIKWIELILKFKKSGMSLENIKKYIELAKLGDSTKKERRDILIELKESLEERIKELQECLDITTYKINNYYNLCDPTITEIIDNWKNK